MVVVLDTVSGPAARHPEKAHRPDQPALKKPDWIRVKAPVSRGYAETHAIVRANGLHTVCEEAGCPNIGECWDKKHATFMIMGDTCTRACAFCNVKTGLPGALDPDEPQHVAEATAKLGLSHIVVTSVDRDDLADGGAAHFAATIRAIRARCPTTTIEVLTPDFLRKDGALEVVVAAQPDVFNHNLETVPSRYLTVRPGARYFHSIRLLQRVKELDRGMFTKSGIMVGLGEERNEILQVMDDLRSAEVDFLTIGQYLQPTRKHHAVIRAIRTRCPGTTIEVLTPDFLRKEGAVETVVEAEPDVFNHNLETVPSKYLTVRPGARYFASIRLLQRVKEIDAAMFTKSGIMVGLGEERNEILQVMDDLRAAGVDFLTIGQYLQPTRKHHPVVGFVHPDEFKVYETIAYAKGFLMVSSSPLTRSSHHAGEDFARLKAARDGKFGQP